MCCDCETLVSGYIISCCIQRGRNSIPQHMPSETEHADLLLAFTHVAAGLGRVGESGGFWNIIQRETSTPLRWHSISETLGCISHKWHDQQSSQCCQRRLQRSTQIPRQYIPELISENDPCPEDRWETFGRATVKQAGISFKPFIRASGYTQLQNRVNCLTVYIHRLPK